MANARTGGPCGRCCRSSCGCRRSSMDTPPRIGQLLADGCRHLLGQQQRDVFSPTRGCFDRRYWGWKLTDFPDATLQRAVLPLSWWLTRAAGDSGVSAALAEAVEAGLVFSTRLQHAD